ncbi:hypothetical protein LTR97_008593 [Elasticomyces elasticus]|uniref:Uncharacterized protein n=1 Tax=Elasticomyces elasticus TaxID=574655 RepID=A0AAN7VQ90_9PEZI|nr:hypothetical protein LTR97_008593 [Elasticomyces elasticus]
MSRLLTSAPGYKKHAGCMLGTMQLWGPNGQLPHERYNAWVDEMRVIEDRQVKILVAFPVDIFFSEMSLGDKDFVDVGNQPQELIFTVWDRGKEGNLAQVKY